MPSPFWYRVIRPILVRSEERLEKHQSPVKAVTRQVTFVPVVEKRFRVYVVQDSQREGLPVGLHLRQ